VSITTDKVMMRRAIAAAMANLGQTWPNPSVGCVIAKDDKILGQAATAKGGRPHAEEQALEALGEAARGATAYVTLEPCGARSSGRTSCAERLAVAGISRVVIACEDPSPFASGQGLERLSEAGLVAETGLLADEARILCDGFIHRLTTGQPMVEAADRPETFDAQFEPMPGEPLIEALKRYGNLGYTRLWTPRGGPLSWELSRQGLLATRA
jgi:diaminohydroxyphosphoribosylaminopyrimidine deaminase/5-amino-6-(5-phosphoribosylamino)uracil reductase